MSTRSVSSYWSMGTAIGLCAAVGVVLGAILGNVVWWLLGGAAVGVVLGAVTVVRKRDAAPTGHDAGPGRSAQE